MGACEFVTVKYTCEVCGIKDREVKVQARLPGENVVFWLEQVCANRVTRDHLARSPLCRATKMTNLMVPIEGDLIGGTKGADRGKA